MNIRNVGHSMKYEAECVAMLFFPDEKIVTEEFPLTAPSPCAQEDCIENRLENQVMRVTLCLNGEKTQLEQAVPQNPTSPYEEAEFIMCDLMYRLLQKATGVSAAWGMLTGVRPVKLFHKRLDEGKTPQQTGEEFAKHFHVSREKIELALETARHEAPILKEATDDTFSLYVSIPFCPSRCSYCSFVSHDIASKRAKEILPVYVEKLCEELKAIGSRVKNTGLTLTTVYFGGGTPTILSAEQLDRVCTAVKENFDLSRLKEYTVEAGRPDTITRKKLKVLRKHNISRISINPQTLNDEVLEAIGRKHTAKEIEDCFLTAREEGFDNINMDLIIGLPEEDINDVRATMEEIKELAPDSVTVHSLAIKRAARLNIFKERYADLKIENTQEMIDLTAEYARSMGLVPYYLYRQKNMAGNFENVGYAAPDKACIYNILIMEEKQTIVACGAGTTTKVVFPAENRLERVENVKDVDQYIARIDEMIGRKEKMLEKLDGLS